MERTRGSRSSVVYLEDPAVNEPDTNGGRQLVRIECLDEGGAVIFEGQESWPFSDTDGGIFDPHVHFFVKPEVVGEIASCRLPDTDPQLEGPKV